MVTDEDARSAASEILAAQEFTRWNTDYESWLRLLEKIGELVPNWLIDVLSWLLRVLETILDGIARFLSFFGIFGDASSGVGWVALCLLGAALIVLVRRWQSQRDLRIGSSAAPRSPGRLHADALLDARALARDGHYLLAAHCVQLATLTYLIEFDWLELARSEPNRTLRDRVKQSSLPPREKLQLVDLVDRLEMLWFNEPRDDPALFEDWISLDDRIVTIATGGRE